MQVAVGRLTVVVDGQTWTTVMTTSASRSIALTKRLHRGRHTVRVRFRPDDRTLYRPARSALKRIVVAAA
jgi:hypothetical protein